MIAAIVRRELSGFLVIKVGAEQCRPNGAWRG